jgi:hypothetical protein
MLGMNRKMFSRGASSEASATPLADPLPLDLASGSESEGVWAFAACRRVCGLMVLIGFVLLYVKGEASSCRDYQGGVAYHVAAAEFGSR